MKYCSTCGKELSEGAKFCESCGAKVPQMPTGTVQTTQSIHVTQPVPPVGNTQTVPQMVSPVSVPEKKKSGVGLIIALAAVVLLVIGGAVGFLLLRPEQDPDGTYSDNNGGMVINTPSPASPSSKPTAEPTPGVDAQMTFAPETNTEKSLREKFEETGVDITKIVMMNLEGTKLVFEDNSYQYSLKFTDDTFNFNDLQGFTSLHDVIVRDVASVHLPDDPMTLVTLKIYNAKIENLPWLGMLHGLQRVTLNNCGLTDCLPLAECVDLKYAELKDNPIYDYRPLGNIPEVQIWDTGSLEQPKDRGVRMVRVNVSNLRIRTTPTKVNDKNLTGKKCTEGAYYIIIGEYYSDSDNMLWYRIGNDQWIGDGSWLEIVQ